MHRCVTSSAPAASASSTTGAGRRAVLLGAAGVGASMLVGGRGLPALATDDPEQQSPIDIRTRRVVAAPQAAPLVVDYPRRTRADLVYVHREEGDDGCGERREDETVQAQEFGQEAFLRRGRHTYRLLQTHFHIRSEHTVDGRAFAMEQHFVHERVGDGRRLVLAVFLVPRSGGLPVVPEEPRDEVSRRAPQDRLLQVLPKECAPEALHLDHVDLDAMLPRRLESWTYRGSLTTPPYDEGIEWHVLRQPRHVDAATVRRFGRLFTEGDSRGPQPLNGRPVRLVRGRRG